MVPTFTSPWRYLYSSDYFSKLTEAPVIATVGAFGCGTMLVWSSPAQNYYDPRYCHNEDYGCDIVMSKQEAIWVNAIAFLGCIFCVPVAGEKII